MLKLIAQRGVDRYCRSVGLIFCRRKMSEVYVRSVESEDRLQLNFSWVNPTNGKERLFNFDRSKNETLSATLGRVNANLSKFMNKKKKKKKDDDTEADQSVGVKLLLNGEICEDTVVNEDAWVNGAELILDELKYKIVFNPPQVQKIRTPEHVMVGFEIKPIIDVEFADLEKCIITWFRKTSPELSEMNSETADTHAHKKCKLENDLDDQWVEIGKGLAYIPTTEDLNQRIKFACVPANDSVRGPIKESEELVVQEGPKNMPFLRRQELHTKDYTDSDSLRVMTYNILADVYADSDFSRGYLFPYCPEHALKYDYRKQLLAKEIPGYKTDIACLQECDSKMFKNVLEPRMSQEGYEGYMKAKPGEVSEGCAIFYRKSKLRLVADHTLEDMLGAFQRDDLYSDLRSKVMGIEDEEQRDKILQRKTVLQVAALESIEDPTRLLLMATTHFYFHPRANHIRLIQAMIVLRHLERLVKRYKEQNKNPGVVFCGDLNSASTFGVYQLLTTGKVPGNHADWWSEGKAGYMGELPLNQPFDFENACGVPPYTNYVTSFAGCLDYVFVDKTKFTTKKVIPLPTHEEVTQNVALPNIHFPSDHLPVICEIKWK